MRILILGASGMLGSAMLRVLSKFPDHDVYGTLRSSSAINTFDEKLRSRLVAGVDISVKDQLIRVLNDVRPDCVVNCVGVIKQLEAAYDPLTVLPINSLFPHRLCNLCTLVGARLIHISTDCVFLGTRGMYLESEQPDARDLYGISKYLGEVMGPGAITLRTSIIGHEIGSATSLIDWYLSQTAPIKGYEKAIFSGLPTNELAAVIGNYVLPRPDMSGLYHVSADPISKFDLLSLVSRVYAHDPGIVADSDLVIDRSLDSTRFRDLTGYEPPQWPQLIRDMHAFRTGK